MKLKNIDLDGFGKLVKKTYKFDPGLNLIYGRNEAGKSTLQRSIFAALYGFFDEGSITPAKRAVMSAYEPWDSKAIFGLKLLFELDGGTQYRVERTFAPKADTILFDVKHGKNVTTKFPSSSHGRLHFADPILGMSREVFENTSLVRQAELAALEKSASAISDTLLRLSASAMQESTASQAIELLGATLKEQIGTQRSRNKPLPEKQNRLEALKAARSQLNAEYQVLANQIHELSQAEEIFHRVQLDYDKAEYLFLLAQQLSSNKQREAIEKADAEVEQRKQEVLRYQAWANFRSDNQSKIERMATQHEKSQSDAQRAEKLARRAQQRLFSFLSQLDALHTALNEPRLTSDLPGLENLSASDASYAVRNWQEEELSSLEYAINKQRKAFDATTQELGDLCKIGHNGISRDQKELMRLETELEQAKQAIRQIQKSIKQFDNPADKTKNSLAAAEANVEKWKAWENFPAVSRDELLQLAAQYTPLRESLISSSQQIADTENKLTSLQAQANDLQQLISKLESVRNVPQQEKSRIQEILSQLEIAKQTAASAQIQYVEYDQIYQSQQQTFNAEIGDIKLLEQLGIAGLNQLQQRWLNATQQFASTKTRFEQSQESWGKVGMPIAEFQRLENAVREIQSGKSPTPKPRRGCGSVFAPKSKNQLAQIPTEITVYSQIQPIFAEFLRQQDEIRSREDTLKTVESEIRKNLGPLASGEIRETTFADCVAKLQEYQQKSRQIEQQKNLLEAHRSRYQQAQEVVQQLKTRIERDLSGFGFVFSNLEDALNQYFKACEQKEELISTTSALERVQAQVEILRQQFDAFKLQEKKLEQTEEKIFALFANAKIQGNPGSIQDGVRQFNEGVENNRKWKEAQAQLDLIKKQVSEFEERRQEAQSQEMSKKENLTDFRTRLIEKYSGLLKENFTIENLDGLDVDLQAYYTAQAKFDKVVGQAEQLNSQILSIHQEIDDWAEKDTANKLLENTLLQEIQDAGVDISQISLDEALHRFEDAVKGFAQWQKAQRFYDSAVQTQTAVRNSLSKSETEIATRSVKIKTIITDHPEWENLTVSEKTEVYEQNCARLNSRLLQERDRLTRLREEAKRGVKGLRHLAELDEEIYLVNTELQQLNNFGDALQLAADELTTATHEFQKMFAPRLERIVEGGLEHITSGRYRKVKVDPNSLNVQVLAPERNEMVDTAQLSTGTRDLVYLVLRMGITQLMSSSGENLPLLLDDPFVEFDYPRQKAALSYLGTLAEKTQVVLFTKEDQIVTWLSQSGINYNLIELS